MSVGSLVWASAAGELFIDAGAGADNGVPDDFLLTRQGDQLQVSVDGQLAYTADLDGISSIHVDGSSDADTLTVDFSNGDPIPSGGLFFDAGGTVQGSDSLIIARGSLNGVIETVTQRFERIDEGQISLSLSSSSQPSLTSTIAFTGLTSSDQVQPNVSILGGEADTIRFSGPIDLHGGSLYAAAGSIEVDGTITSPGGSVRLDAGVNGTLLVSGTIDVSAAATGQTGGTVHLLGKQVGLTGSARIDASGDAGGGTILIGGDFQGNNPLIRNATATYLGADVTVSADALGRGDGGTIILWSDGVSRVYGTLTARGGILAGDGGLVETSGHQLLLAAAPDVSAPAGRAGNWLLDPEDVSITNATANVTSAGSGDPGPVTFAPTAANTTTTLNAADIVTALNAGSNVTVQTTSSGTTTPGRITVDAAITKTADGGSSDGSTLTLTAADAIILNQAITSTTGTLNLVLQGTGITETVSGNAFSGGTLTIKGDLSPGLSGTGTFDADGAVTFDSTSRFLVNLNGTGSFDQLLVNGASRTVTLAGARLVLTLDSVPPPGSGQSFKILDTTGATPILSGVSKNADGTADLNDGGKFTVGSTVFRINYTGGDVILTEANTAPTLTAFTAAVDTTAEDTQVEITFADLAAQGNEADVDGTVTAFVVQSVSSGTLKIGTDAGTATAFAAGSNDTIDAMNKAFWTPGQNANGTLNALAVVAKDNSGATSATSVTAQVSVTAVNDAPSLTATAGTPTFTENGTAVALYSGTTIDLVEAGDKVKTLVLTVSGLQNGASEILVVDGTDVALTQGISGTTATTGIGYSVAVSGGTATVTLTKTGDLTVVQARNLVNGLKYKNTSEDPLGSSRTVTLASIQDSGGTTGGGNDTAALSIASAVTVVAVNDEPSLTATAGNPTFTENGAAVALYSGTTIDLVETGDKVKTLVLTVSGLQDGSSEILVVDGTEVALTDGTSGTTTATGIGYSVAVSGSTATVTLTKTGDIAVADAQTLVDGLRYKNTSELPLTANRTVTLKSIQDSGGAAGASDDTKALSIASAVTLTGVNDEPSLTATAGNPTFIENGTAVALYSGTAIDLVETGDKVKTLVLTVSGLQNGASEILVVDGWDVALTNGINGTTTATSIGYSVTVSSGTATVTLTRTGNMTVAQAQTLVNGLKYKNTSEAPLGASRTVTLASIQDSGGTVGGGDDTAALSIASAVTVTAVNDEPNLTATASNPTFTENGAAVALYSGTAINVVEAADKVKTLVLTVSGLQNGASEILVVDGTDVALTQGTSGTTTAAGISYSVTVSSGTATVTLTKTGDLTVAEAQTLVDGLKYKNNSEDPLGASRTVTLASIQDSGGTVGGGDDTAALSIASAVTVTAVNDEPSLTATASNPTFTENGAAVALYSGTAINVVEAGDKVKTLVLTVSGLQNGASEILVVDGTDVVLTQGTSGTTTATGISYSVTVSSGTATVTLTKTGDLTVAEAQTLVDGLLYKNTSEDPLGASRTVTLASIQDSGGTVGGGDDTAALSIASAVTVTAVNDEPSLTATASNPTFTENGAAVALYSGTAINLVEAGDKVKTLVLTVSGLQNGASEILVVDGTDVALTNGTSGTTTTTGIGYSVTVSSGTATVTLTKTGDLTVAEAQALVDGLKYKNTSEDPLGASRTVTLASIQDSGGTVGGGDDTAALSIASAVTVTAVNDEPSLTATASNPTFTENGSAVALYSGTAINVVEAGDKVKTLVLTVSGLQNEASEILVVDGTDVALTQGTSGTTTATGISYSVTVSSGTATVTLTKTGDLTVAEAQTLVDGLLYKNTSEDPLGASRTVTLASIQDSGGTVGGGDDTAALSIASAVTVTAVNDEPSLTATASNPTFTENGAAVALYSGTAINLVEAGDKVKTLVLTVSGLQNGASEILVVDGTDVALTNGTSGTTTTTGIGYSVTVSSGTATVTLTKTGDLTVAEAQALVDGLKYKNTSEDPLAANRTVTLTSIQDGGGTNGGGDDTAVLSIASAVTVTAVNDAPDVDLDATTGGYDTSLSVLAGEGPVVIAPQAAVSDVDSSNFTGGTLTVTITNAVAAEDVLSIRDQGTGAGQIGFSGGNVTFGGTLIGTASGGTGATPLVVQLNSAATPAAVQALVAGVTYENTTAEPNTTTRSVQFVVNDGADDSLARTASVVLPDTFISLTGSDLSISDVNSTTNDLLTIRIVGSAIEIRDPGRVLASDVAGATGTGTDTVTVPLSSFAGSLGLSTGTGNDSVTLDFSSDDFPCGVQYNGGAGSDRLQLSGDTFAAQQFGIADADTGSTALPGNSAISFDLVEAVDSTLTVTATTINFSTAGETISVSDSGTAGRTTVASDQTPPITFENPAGTLALNVGGTNNDTIRIFGLGSGFQASLTLDGQGGTDTVVVSGAIDIGSGTLTVAAENVNFDSATTAQSLNVTGNTVTQAAALTVSGTATFDVGTNALSLMHTQNDFGAVNVTAGAVQLTDASGVQLGTVSASSLEVTAVTGNITDSGTVTVSGAAAFTTSQTDADIDLGTLAVTGSISLSTSGTTGNATLVNTTAVDLSTSIVGGNLTVTAATGDITDSGTVTVGGTAGFATGQIEADIKLDTLAATGAIRLSTSGTTGNATIVNATAVDLAATTVGGNLDATATAGNITDSGPVTVGGTAGFTTSELDADIDLGTLAVTGKIRLSTIGTAGNATIINATAVDLAATTVGGNLNATATAGNLTDSGPVTVGGTAGFATSQIEADIQLDSLAVTGWIALTTSGMTGNATLVNATAVDLAATTIGGNLIATATAGNLSDSGPVTVGGTADFTTSQTDADINLDTLAVTGAIRLGTSGMTGNATIGNATAVDLAASTVGGNLIATAATGNLSDSGLVTVGGTAGLTTSETDADIHLDTLAVTGGISLTTSGTTGNATLVNATTVDLATSTVGGNLDATASTGNLTDSGPVTVGGTAGFTTSETDADINLDTLAVTGAIRLSTSGTTGNAKLVNATAVDLAASTVGGNLFATASIGNLADSGVVTVGGTAGFATSQADADIHLDTLAVTGAIGLSTNGTAGDATIVNATAVDLAASTVGGNLTATAATGNLSDSGVVTVGGTAGFTTSETDADINLDTLAVTGAIRLSTSGTTGNATLVNAGAVDLAASTVGGNLDATATAGNITDNGIVTVGGTAGMTTSQADADINLDTLAVTGAIRLSTSGTTGNATLVNATAVDLATSTVGGNLDATASTGNLSDSGPVTVGGTAGFTTSQNNADIQLDTLAVTGAIRLSTSGTTGNAMLVNATAVDLAASTVGGNLDATATRGNVTDSGVVTVGGAAGFTTGETDADINLDTLAVTGAIRLSTSGTAGDAMLVNATALDLAASTVGGNLSVAATTGNLTDSGVVTVGGAAGFTTSQLDADIELDTLAVTGAIRLTTSGTAGNAVIINATAFDLAASTVGGNLVATAATGNITDSGPVTVSGAAGFTTGETDADINLDTLAVTGAIRLNTSGTTGNATLVNATAVDLAASTVGGNLAATAATGNLTDSGPVTVSGTAGFTTGETDADINLDSLAVTGAIGLSTRGTAGDATIVNATAVDLAASTVGGNLIATAATGNLTDSGLVTVGGAAGFTTSQLDAGIDLDTLAVTGAIRLSTSGTAGNATVVNATALDLGASTVGGNLVATASTGTLTILGDVTAGGSLTLQSDVAIILAAALGTAGGDITLNAPVRLASDLTPVLVASGGGNILFTASVDSVTGRANSLRVSAGAGQVTFSAKVGATDPLGGLTILSAGDINVHGDMTALAGGITFTNAQTLTIAGGTNLQAGGEVLQNGSGPVLLGGNVRTANGEVTFSSPLTLLQSVTVDTSTGGKNILFGGAIDGTLAGVENLILTAGTGDITLPGAVGVQTRLGALVLVSAGNVRAGAITAAALTQLAGSGTTTFFGSVDTTGPIVVGLQSPILGGIVFDGGGSPLTLTATGAAAGALSDVRLNGAMTLRSDLSVNASAGVALAGTLNSQPGQPQNLQIIAGPQGVIFQGDVGNSPGDLGVLHTIDVRTEGVLMIADGVVLRTSSGAVSNVPPRVRIVEKFPDRPLGEDGLQLLVGTVGGIGVPGDNAEFGQHLILIVTWGDEPPTAQTVSAGEQVELITDNTGTRTWTVTPGPGNGPIDVSLTLAFSEFYIFEQAAKNAGVVETTIRVANDPSISLFGRPAPNLLPQDLGVANASLNSATVKIVTRLPVNPMVFPAKPPTFAPPRESLPLAFARPAQEVRNTPPQVTQSEEIQSRGEVTVDAARELLIVKVNPDGSNGPAHQLPPTALADLKLLFERLVQEGLPDGRYRIYLREAGFPLRMLIDFNKSGTSIGDPVREPGPGSNPIPPAPANGTATTAPPAGTEQATPAMAGVAFAGWCAVAMRGRWSAIRNRVVKDSETRRFTPGARWRRRFE